MYTRYTNSDSVRSIVHTTDGYRVHTRSVIEPSSSLSMASSSSQQQAASPPPASQIPSGSQPTSRIFVTASGSSLPVFVDSNGVTNNRPKLMRTLRVSVLVVSVASADLVLDPLISFISSPFNRLTERKSAPT